MPTKRPYTEAQAETFELVHATREAHGASVADTVRALQASENPRLKGYIWSFAGLLDVLESEAYLEWRRDYMRFLGMHAEIQAAKQASMAASVTKKMQVGRPRKKESQESKVAPPPKQTDTAFLIGANEE
jgi:hypothetical protein